MAHVHTADAPRVPGYLGVHTRLTRAHGGHVCTLRPHTLSQVGLLHRHSQQLGLSLTLRPGLSTPSRPRLATVRGTLGRCRRPCCGGIFSAGEEGSGPPAPGNCVQEPSCSASGQKPGPHWPCRSSLGPASASLSPTGPRQLAWMRSRGGGSRGWQCFQHLRPVQGPDPPQDSPLAPLSPVSSPSCLVGAQTPRDPWERRPQRWVPAHEFFMPLFEQWDQTAPERSEAVINARAEKGRRPLLLNSRADWCLPVCGADRQPRPQPVAAQGLEGVQGGLGDGGQARSRLFG